MTILRPSRVIGALLAIISMLFMQLVLAGYVCPKAPVDAPAASMSVSAGPVAMADMPDCEQMDVVQPGLCHANAHPLDPSLQKPELPSVQPFVASTIALVLMHVVEPTVSNQFQRNSVRQSGAPPPPLAIRHCCFRI